MTSKKLIASLEELKNVKADENFLKENRSLLLSQISNSGAEEISTWQKFFISLENLAKVSARPAVSLAVFVFVLISAGLFGDRVLESSKPNDSLYIARVLSERVKVNTTFNSEEREKLLSQYAIRHAEDIMNILSDENFNKEENTDQVAKLSESFKTELNKASVAINKITPTEKVSEVIELSEENSLIENNSDLVVIAENDKEENGLEILIAKDPELSEVEEVKPTSTISVAEEINTLFEKGEYEAAREKLNKVKESLK